MAVQQNPIIPIAILGRISANSPSSSMSIFLQILPCSAKSKTQPNLAAPDAGGFFSSDAYGYFEYQIANDPEVHTSINFPDIPS